MVLYKGKTYNTQKIIKQSVLIFYNLFVFVGSFKGKDGNWRRLYFYPTYFIKQLMQVMTTAKD